MATEHLDSSWPILVLPDCSPSPEGKVDALTLIGRGLAPAAKWFPLVGEKCMERFRKMPKEKEQRAAQSKYKRYRFSPMDDRRLLACTSRNELLETICAIVNETQYPRRRVVHRAKALGVWNKVTPPWRKITTQEKVSVQKLLTRVNTQATLISAVASRLGITKAAARSRLYKDPTLVDCLNTGKHSLEEVAWGFCVRKATIRGYISSGLLQANKIQESGKWRITSASIAKFALEHPRLIDWDRVMKKSLWLKDVLEMVRISELTSLLNVTPKTIRAWIEKGLLVLPFNPHRIGDLFSDQPIYRFLDQYPDLVDLADCTSKSPDWFAKYEKVKGRYPRKDLARDKERAAIAVDGRYELLL